MNRQAEEESRRAAGEAFIREICAKLGDDPDAVAILYEVGSYAVRRPGKRPVTVLRKPVDDKEAETVERLLIP